MRYSIQDSLDFFGVTSEGIGQVLSAAMQGGCDFADLYFEQKKIESLSLSDHKVNAMGINVEFGVGIRAVNGDKTGYSYVENTELSEMLSAARLASKIASSGEGRMIVPLNHEPIRKNHYPILQGWDGVGMADRSGVLARLNEAIFALDERVIKVRAVLNVSETHVLIANSRGVLRGDIRPMVSLAATCVMMNGEQVENYSSSRSFRMGGEFLTEAVIREIAEEVVSKCAFLFGASQPKGGEMCVVMGSGASGILLHEAIGHAFEADFNRKGISIFSDKLGKQICNSSINVVDDGTLMHNRGSVNFDDEGVDAQQTYIVRDGVLSGYLHDLMSASYYNVAPTGNGRRENFKCYPLPRMRSTYMLSGNDREADMIASVKKGVFVESFSNGQVQIGAGDFTFFVKTGYLIEDGCLTQPIKDVNIIGNGPKALADISMVGDNLSIDNGTWTCGKDGQSAPVTCGMPSVKVDKLIVGGGN